MAKKKLAKKFAGVKIPKVLRKSGLLKALLGSPTGRQILADVILAAAGAAAGVLAQKHADEVKGAGPARGTGKAGNLAKEMVQSAAGAVTDVLGEAARSVLPAAKRDDKRPDRRGKPGPQPH
jgi:hypothetical protein